MATTTTANGYTTTTTTTVNIGSKPVVIAGSYVSNTDPQNPWYQSQTRAGFQTLNPIARGILEGSPINYNNLNLTRVCDFKFVFNFGISMFGLINPAVALTQAIKNARLRSAAFIRAALSNLIDGFRTAIKTILLLLGFDPTGYFSKMYSLSKDTIRNINAVIKKIAQMVEDVFFYVALYQDIQALIKWIASLPNELKNLLQRCLTNFQSSMKQFTEQLKAIPGQIKGEVENVSNYFTQGLNDSLKTLNNSLDSNNANAPTTLLPLLDGSNKSSDYDNFKTFLSENIPSTEEVKAGTTAEKMDPKNQELP